MLWVIQSWQWDDGINTGSIFAMALVISFHIGLSPDSQIVFKTGIEKRPDVMAGNLQTGGLLTLSAPLILLRSGLAPKLPCLVSHCSSREQNLRKPEEQISSQPLYSASVVIYIILPSLSLSPSLSFCSLQTFWCQLSVLERHCIRSQTIKKIKYQLSKNCI